MGHMSVFCLDTLIKKRNKSKGFIFNLKCIRYFYVSIAVSIYFKHENIILKRMRPFKLTKSIK